MRWLRAALAVAGVCAVGYGGYGWLADNRADLFGWLAFLAAGAVAHDLIVLPVAALAGLLVARVLPAWACRPVQGGLFASAVLTALALPFVLGFGRLPDNPSALPQRYGAGLLVILAGIWTVALAMAFVNRYNFRREPP
jgi:hypothetical protein